MKTPLSERDKALVYTRTMEAMRNFLEPRHVMVVQHNGQSIVDHGSGVCVRIGDKRLIVTAGHVIKGCPEECISLVWSRTPDNRAVRFSRVEVMGGGEDDKLDFGVLELDESAAFVAKEFIDVSFFEHVLQDRDLNGQIIAAHGFPGDWRRNELQNVYPATPLTRDLHILDPILWTGDGIAETEIEFESPHVVVQPFDDRRTHMPTIAGMSGGTVWACNLATSDIWTPANAKILGVIRNRDDENERLRVFRADHVLGLLRLYYDC